MSACFRYGIALFLFLFSASDVLSLSNLSVIYSDQSTAHVTDKVEYKLVENQWSTAEVYEEDEWLQTDKKALNFGMTKMGVWLRLLLTSPTPSNLVIESPIVDRCVLYRWDQSNSELLVIDSCGLKLNRFNNEDSYINFSLPQVDSVLFYLYVESDLGLTLPITISSKEAYQAGHENRILLFGLIIGIFGVIFFYNLFLFSFTKIFIYIYYCLYVIGIFTTQIILSSQGNSHVFMHLGSAAMNTLFISTSIMGIFAGLFIYEYFRQEIVHISFIRYGLKVMIISSATIPLLLVLFNRNFAFIVLNIILIYGSIICLISSYWLLLLGSKRARFIALAWTLLLLGSLVYILSSFGMIPFSRFSQYSILIGGSLETILLSFALGFRIRELQEDRERTEVFALEQASRNQELEIGFNLTQLRALRSQMNPHFLFNALNSIQSSILFDDRERAADLLVKFSNLMRQALEHSRQEAIPLSEEISFLKNYLELEKMRRGLPFTVVVDVDKDLLKINPSIPPSMLQPLCENALKHAFNHNNGKEENRLEITIRKGNHIDIVLAEIQDNGSGFQGHEAKVGKRSVGLSIIRERVALLNNQGKDASVEIIPKWKMPGGTGTLVKVRLPVLSV